MLTARSGGGHEDAANNKSFVKLDRKDGVLLTRVLFSILEEQKGAAHAMINDLWTCGAIPFSVHLDLNGFSPRPSFPCFPKSGVQTSGPVLKDTRLVCSRAGRLARHLSGPCQNYG